MAAFTEEKVLEVHHWNDTLFSFKCTRPQSLRFENGQFIMIGLMVNEKPLMRAYSVVSANYEEYLEFLSIKVQNGPLTSRLQHLKVGDLVLIGQKSTGTLVLDELFKGGENLWLLATGTGLAPFMALIKDPTVYEIYKRVILFHGVRIVSELAYENTIVADLPANEFIGEEVSKKLIYYPSVTREKFKNQGRLTDLIITGKLFTQIGMNRFNTEVDRAMICGSPSMLKDTSALLMKHGMTEAKRGNKGHFVIERAFVE